MRSKGRGWIFWLLASSLFQLILCKGIDASTTNEAQARDSQKSIRNVFSPRMDYDQWKPIGHGDPLKNDPTYDYVPPVLDRVHYWVDSAPRKPDTSSETHKTEILLLGVSAKKPSTVSQLETRRDTFDPYLKYIEDQKINNHQRIARPHFTGPSYFPSLFFPNKNKVPERNLYSKGNEQRVPYTVLVPPPMSVTQPTTSLTSLPISKSTSSFSTNLSRSTFSTSTPSPYIAWPTRKAPSEVAIQNSNLIYQSSSLVNPGTTLSNVRTTWNANTAPPSLKTTQSLAQPPYNENIVFQSPLQLPESYIHIDFGAPIFNFTQKPLIGSSSDYNLNFVTPPALQGDISSEIMHKGQVSDDNLDIQNTYVKIGKTEAQVHTSDLNSPSILVSQTKLFDTSHSSLNDQIGLVASSGVLHTLQTIQPPPFTLNVVQKPPNLPTHSFKEEPIIQATFSDSTNIQDTSILPTYFQQESTTETTTETTRTETTGTTSTALTTDPLFKHYKQPVEPLKGPLYLIIQGHSKVKTYGPSKQIHGISVQETNEVSEDRDESKYRVKHRQNYETEIDKPKGFREGRSGDLQTLKHVIQTGLGAIDSADLEPMETRDEVKETELQVGYKVVDADQVTSEKYRKGIVEEARKMKN